MFQEKVLAVSRKWAMAQMYQSDVIAKHQSKYTVKLVWEHRLCQFHIDSRMINGEKQLLFGLCWFSTRFLKNGSYSDLPLSIKPDNIFPMLSAIKYTDRLIFIQQVRQSPKDRIDA
jgi:malate dehydrogenase (quinone)